jgi:two-component system sensor histidine kinase QseC
MRATWSLRGRLTWLLIAVALLAWGTSSAWLYRTAVAEAHRLFDAALVETADAVLAVADHEIRGREHSARRRGRDHEVEDEDDELHDIELARIDHQHAEHVVYQVRRRDGAIVYRSPGAPAQPLAGQDAVGFSTLDAAGEAFRVYSLRAGRDGALIHVAQPLADRARLSRASALRLALPGVVLVLVLVVGVGIVVRKVTQPVVRFSGAIDALEPANTVTVAHDDLPRELKPVGLAIDRLLARVQAALQHERTLTADAAHELRTPLAALRAQAQVALRARQDDERTEALKSVMAGVDRATRLVGAVLTLARLDARYVDPAALPLTNIAEVIGLVVDELAPVAAERSVKVECRLQTCEIRADADALAILVRNLVDNAIRHARSVVEVSVQRDDGQTQIVVSDDGPGVPPEISDRVFDRFFRAGSDGHGAGLGLAMVQRVAELHGAVVSVERSALGGACFNVQFGRQGADPRSQAGSSRTA